MTPEPQPTVKPAKPRLLQDGRDMFWSVVPLAVACIVLAALAGTCSFRPGGKISGSVPSYDAVTGLHADAETLGFPIRVPDLPQGWQPNSGARGSIDDGRADPANPAQRLRAVTSVVGYISPAGMYLSLTQSNADEQKLVGSIHPGMHPTGAEDVDGTRWVVYEGEAPGASEPVWTTRLAGPGGAAQLAITGAGSAEQFRALAAATQAQPPLPANPR